MGGIHTFLVNFYNSGFLSVAVFPSGSNNSLSKWQRVKILVFRFRSQEQQLHMYFMSALQFTKLSHLHRLKVLAAASLQAHLSIPHALWASTQPHGPSFSSVNEPGSHHVSPNPRFSPFHFTQAPPPHSPYFSSNCTSPRKSSLTVLQVRSLCSI